MGFVCVLSLLMLPDITLHDLHPTTDVPHTPFLHDFPNSQFSLPIPISLELLLFCSLDLLLVSLGPNIMIHACTRATHWHKEKDMQFTSFKEYRFFLALE